jgi:hypothetical protein
VIELLKQEGLTDEQITLDRDNIIRTEDGFVSWRYEHGYPYMAHYVTEHPRSLDKAFSVYRAFRDVIGKGTTFLAEVTPDKPYFERFIKFVDKDAKVYAEKQGIKYYILKAKR